MCWVLRQLHGDVLWMLQAVLSTMLSSEVRLRHLLHVLQMSALLQMSTLLQVSALLQMSTLLQAFVLIGLQPAAASSHSPRLPTSISPGLLAVPVSRPWPAGTAMWR